MKTIEERIKFAKKMFDVFAEYTMSPECSEKKLKRMLPRIAINQFRLGYDNTSKEMIDDIEKDMCDCLCIWKNKKLGSYVMND